MTSEERHELRYQRRKARREMKRRRQSPIADSYNSVYSFENLWNSYKHCRKGVAWKGSVQRYIFDAPIRVARVHKQLMAGKYKNVTPHEWDTYERGKPRHIKSVPIGERVVQHCLADNSLIPTLQPMLIYDNGACLKDKGYAFAVHRLDAHLHRFYRKYGSDGYILVFDFSKFYDNVDHTLIDGILKRRISDPEIMHMTDNIMASFGQVGLGLGSQISQILALTSANEMDHVVKQELGVEFYARFNDDGYLIHHSKQYLKHCLARIEQVCAKLHIRLNRMKTQIVKLSHGFKFLKARIYLTQAGKVIRKISKKRIAVERRKLKKLKKKLLDGIVDLKHIVMQYESWRADALLFFRAKRTVWSMDALFYSLYPNAPRLKDPRK